MTQRTRYFLVGSALVVVIGLGTGLVASATAACRSAPHSQDSRAGLRPG